MKVNQEITKKFIAKLVRIEPIVMGVFLLYFALYNTANRLPEIVFVISGSTLSMIMYARGSFEKNEGYTGRDIFIHRLLYWSLALGILALLFHLQNWPGEKPMVYSSLLIYLFVGIFIITGPKPYKRYINLIELSCLVLVVVYFGKYLFS